MIRKHLLDKLIERSREARDQAASEAASAQRTHKSAQSTLAMLGQYRRDYDLRAPKNQQAPTDAQRVVCHEAFVGQLERAHTDQTARTKVTAGVVAERDAVLVERQRRLKAFETLLSRREQAQALRRNRLDQSINDEHAARMARAASGNKGYRP